MSGFLTYEKSDRLKWSDQGIIDRSTVIQCLLELGCASHHSPNQKKHLFGEIKLVGLLQTCRQVSVIGRGMLIVCFVY